MGGIPIFAGDDDVCAFTFDELYGSAFGGDGHDDAEHGRTEAAAAANLDLKSEWKFVSIWQMIQLVPRTLSQLV